MISAKWMASAESWPKRSITNYTNPVAIKIPLNIPIVLTWLRIAAIPLFVAVLYFSDDWLTAYPANIFFTRIFFSPALTHLLGCYLGRQWKQKSPFRPLFPPFPGKLI